MAENIINAGGLADNLQAKQIAKQILEHYDKDKTDIITDKEAGNFIHDAHRQIHGNFIPEKKDQEQLLQILDIDRNGKVNISDLEQVAIKYLVGDGYNLGKSQRISSQKEKRKTVVEERIEKAKLLFNKIAKDKTELEFEDVSQLMVEQYKNLGITYSPTEQEIKAWIAYVDRDEDGKITYKDYEIYVIKGLQRAGIKLS